MIHTLAGWHLGWLIVAPGIAGVVILLGVPNTPVGWIFGAVAMAAVVVGLLFAPYRTEFKEDGTVEVRCLARSQIVIPSRITEVEFLVASRGRKGPVVLRGPDGDVRLWRATPGMTELIAAVQRGRSDVVIKGTA